MADLLDDKTTQLTEPRASVQKALADVTSLLRKHRLVEGLIEDQRSGEDRDEATELAESAVYKKSKAALQRRLDRLHPADVAYILEALPLDERLVIWNLVKAERDGEILLEVSDAVPESPPASMDEDELVAATEQLDTDEIADLAPDLPREVIQDVFKSLSPQERDQLREALSYPEDTVGALMDFDMISVREDMTLEVVLRHLRQLDDMPDHTDQLFVVDRAGKLKGLLRVDRLLVTDPEARVATVMRHDFIKF